jgi:dihydroorotase
MEERSCWTEGACLSLVVRGKIFLSGRLLDGCILVEDGRIAKIAKELSGEEFRFGRDRVVLPGLVDMHVHLRDFELSYKEDFETGTMAAAMGGFTAVADMPNTRPPVNRPSVLRKREEVARRKSFVDYALYYGVPEREPDLKDEIGKLAVGVKIFMHREFYGGRKEMVIKTLKFAARKNLPVICHAENPGFFVRTGMGEVGTPEAEAEAIKDAVRMVGELGFRLHLTHLSSRAGTEVFARLKAKGISADTCPHYLLLTRENLGRLGGLAFVHPSIKEMEDRRALLRMLREGVIDAVTSDHAPHSLDEKMSERPVPGFPGLETTLPLLLTMVNRGLLSMRDIVRACAERPAEILGLRGIGKIEVGAWANFTVVDLRRTWRIDPSEFKSKARFSPFAGRTVKGMPVATIVRGEPVMLEREIVGKKGWGKNVKTLC